MPTVGFIYDEIFLRHQPPAWHPDSPDRLLNIIALLKAARLWDRLTIIRPCRATEADLAQVHSREHIERMRTMSAGPIDPDTFVSAGSYEAALHAAGAVREAVEQSRHNGLRRVFCAVRPPGHHAEPDRPMGFCLFNNVAVGAAHALKIGYGRVGIIDFDAHHGNGTQHIFDQDDRVLYISTHQHPYYPETGKDGERGSGKGEGYTYNMPVLAGSGDKEYLALYQDILPAVVRRYAPEILLVSAGYDVHVNDPHANIRVTHEGIRAIVRSILDSADAPIVFVLEGGYDLASLSESVTITIEEMLKC